MSRVDSESSPWAIASHRRPWLVAALPVVLFVINVSGFVIGAGLSIAEVTGTVALGLLQAAPLLACWLDRRSAWWALAVLSAGDVLIDGLLTLGGLVSCAATLVIGVALGLRGAKGRWAASRPSTFWDPAVALVIAIASTGLVVWASR